MKATAAASPASGVVASGEAAGSIPGFASHAGSKLKRRASRRPARTTAQQLLFVLLTQKHPAVRLGALPAVTACEVMSESWLARSHQMQSSDTPFVAAFAAVEAPPAAASVAPPGGEDSCRASRVSLRSAGVSETRCPQKVQTPQDSVAQEHRVDVMLLSHTAALTLCGMLPSQRQSVSKREDLTSCARLHQGVAGMLQGSVMCWQAHQQRRWCRL